MIRFECECGRQLQARDELAGRDATCPGCGRPVPIPGPGAVRADEPPRAGPVAVQVERPDDRDEPDEPRPRRRLDDGEGRFEAPAATSGKATASLVLGLASFVCFLNILTGLPAVILGAIALGDIGRSRGRLGGKGLAVGGIVTGVLGMVVLLPALVLLPAVSRVRDAAARMSSTNNLKQVGLAMHEHHDKKGRFPPAYSRSPDGKPLLSWRVHLLPYIEEEALYRQFKLDEPWDSPHNQKLLDKMPKVYKMPNRDAGPGMTYYCVFTGPGTAFDKPEGVRLQEFPDMTSNTILVAEAAQAVPWTKPDAELPFSPTGPLPALGGHFKAGFHVLMADGSVRTVGPKVGEATLRAAITRNGNDTLGSDW